MMQRLFALTLGMACVAVPASALDVVGNINTTRKWTTADSPVRLLGDVTVAPQAILTIDPGVVIEAATSDQLGSGTSASKVEFIVKGTLVANGTSSNPIVFKGAESGRDTWYGILFDVGSLASQLTNAQISDATTAVWSRSANRPTLSDLTIRAVNTGVLWQSTAQAVLDRLDIGNHAQYGVRLEDDGAAGMTATLTGVVVQSGPTSSIGISIAPRVNATVKRSRMVMNNVGLKTELGSSLTLQNSVLAANWSTGAQLAQATGTTFSVLNNTIDRNVLGANGVGLQIDQVASASAFVVRNNIVTNHQATNGAGIKVAGSTQPSLDTNDVWNNTTNYVGCQAGANSISANPLYVQPLGGSAPSGATWTSVNDSRTLSAPSSSYSWSSPLAFEVPLAAYIRLRLGRLSSSSGGQVNVLDRADASIAYYSSDFTSQTTPAAAGNVIKVQVYRGYYTASLVINGYDYVPLAYNYRLTGSSPAIDVGNSLGAPTEDNDGTRRPYDGDVDGVAKMDLGAYEWHENIAPSVNAGSDQTVLPNTSVTLDGSGSRDADGRIVSWDWDFGDGSAHGTTAVVTHTYATAGTYTAKLTVTDDQGATGFDTAVITVATNLPPKAEAGADQFVQPGATVSFDGGQSSDADGTIVEYLWDFGDGTPAGSGRTVTHAYSRTGVFTVTLTVKDNRGATATDTCSVVVSTGGTTNQAPVAKVSAPQTVTLGQAVTLSSAGSTDPDGSIASYAWDLGNGQTRTTQNVTYTYPAAGSFIVTLTVTDNKGATGTATTAVTVNAPANSPPVSRPGGPYSANVGVAVQFDGSASSDPDGTIASWLWDFGDGSTATTAKAAHAYATAGTFLVRLTVTDNKGASSSDTVLASIIAPNNQPPVARAGGPYSASVGSNILFDGSKSTDSDGTITGWHWDFGDGQAADGVKVAHSFAAGGSYLVRLTVTDNKGASDDDAVLATVSVPGNQPPVARAGGNRSAKAGETVVFDAASSSDPDGTIKTFLWEFGDGTSAQTSRASHAYSEQGSYLVKLTVTDDKGAIGQDIALVSVGSQGNKAPIAQINPASVAKNAGERITFNGSSSTDPDGNIVAYQWDFGDGASAAGQSAVHAYADGGEYTVTLTVFDDKGARASTTAQAVINALPVADAGGNERTVVVGEEATFDGSTSADPDGAIASYAWTFGDGAKAEGATATHAWKVAGTFTVTLLVVDDKGAKADTKIKVTVNPAPVTPPPAAERSGCSQTGSSAVALLGLAAALLAPRRRRMG